MGENGHMLVIGDEPQSCGVLRTMLTEQGYQVWDARSGEEALDLIHSEKFDLVLLDLNLPDMAGIQFCRKIRAVFDMVIIVMAERSNEGGQSRTARCWRRRLSDKAVRRVRALSPHPRQAETA
jgi:DNA-binding response OmpR family regulator